MAEGFVYILLNPSFPEMVKFGLTKRGSERRAKSLWTTGVPTPFIVVYDELVSDAAKVESRLQSRFEGYRVHSAREFFRIPVREAVRALQEEARHFSLNETALANRVEILPQLKSRHERYLKPDIAGVAIVHLPDVCFLEVTRKVRPGGRDEIVERCDLSYILETNGDLMFPVSKSAEENATFLAQEFTALDILMTAMPLFSDDGAQLVWAEWEERVPANQTS